jgi:acyl-CoA synthetase (AMP-forming)/AMP-acid ligase II
LREPDSQLLHEWLRQSAAATPDAAAIVEDERVTTFGELLAQAQLLARCFCRHGIQPRDRIALILPKCTDAIVAVFASLLAGAIYVPIHPRWPRERIDAVLAECDACLLIDGDCTPPKIVDLRTSSSIAWPALAAHEADLALLPRMTSEDTAFILFTSGSTGRPKGVELSHRAVSAFVRWTARELQACGALDKEVNYIAAPDPNAHPTGVQPGDKALVYIVRPHHAMASFPSKVAVDGEWKGVNLSGTYFFLTLEPGLHYFCSEAKTRSLLIFTAEADKTYYIEQQVIFKPHSPVHNLFLLKEADAKLLLAPAALSTWKLN